MPEQSPQLERRSFTPPPETSFRRWREKSHNPNYDQLTGVYDSKFIRKKFKENIVDKNKLTDVVIYFFDLDNLKVINDKGGHNLGDFALVEFTQVLKKTFSRQDDVIARWGGDEFLALIHLKPDSSSKESLDTLTQKFTTNLEIANREMNEKIGFPLAASFGSARFDPYLDLNDNIDYEKKGLMNTLDRADKLMYQQKNAKKMIEADKKSKNVSIKNFLTRILAP